MRATSCTPSTSSEVVEFLVKEGFKVTTSPSMNQIDTYSSAMKLALEFVDERNIQKIFYIDLDRLIHWITFFPNELSKLPKEADVDYLHIGRSARAFETHPETQKSTEVVVNEIASLALEFENVIDILSACFVVNVRLGKKMLASKNDTSMGFYCSWPVTCWAHASSKKYIEVEGLEWETPDRFQDEIKKIGYETWLEQFQTAAEWQNRTELMRECLKELMNIIKMSYIM